MIKRTILTNNSLTEDSSLKTIERTKTATSATKPLTRMTGDIPSESIQ